MENGAVQGGVIDFPPTPAIFNTGQVLFGWAAAYKEIGSDTFARAAKRGADFLVGGDGRGRRLAASRLPIRPRRGERLRCTHGVGLARGVSSDQRCHASRCGRAQPRLRPHEAAGRMAGSRNAAWTTTLVRCCTPSHIRWKASSKRGAILGARAFPARCPAGGRCAPREASARTEVSRGGSTRTGTSRRAGVVSPATRRPRSSGFRFYETTGEERYLRAAERMNRYLSATQDLGSPDPGIRGGIKGSQPIWGEYGSYEYLNWAAKFFADALMLEIRARR